MERKVVQDIVPSNRRSIRNLSSKKLMVEELDGEEEVPIRKVPASSSISRSQQERFAPEPPPRAAPAQRTATRITPPTKNRRFPGIIVTFLIIFIGIAVIAVALSLLYSKAAVTITPKVAQFEINNTFTAKKDTSTSSTSPSSSLLYETITVSSSQLTTIPAADGPLIQTKSKGTITLYNEQVTQQKIVAGTRVSNTGGEVYRTSATVVIPAAKSGTPGTVGVAVLADAAGAEYNMSLNDDHDFTLVAYKGTPKYTTVYGKLKTALTGGFSGNKKSISPEVQKAAVQGLKESLASKLLADAQAKVPKDSVLYMQAYTVEYETPDPVAKDAQNAEVTVKGTLSGAIFKRNSFIKSIAAKELDKFPASSYAIAGLEDLKFSLMNSKDFSAKKGTPLIFTLKGPITLTGSFSETGLKNELKGTNLKDSNAIFAHYPAIANAYALITPFWMRSFPNSPEKIIIEIKK